MTTRTFTFTDAIDRCEKIERIGANNIRDVQERLGMLRVITEAFMLIRNNPSKAYERFIQMGTNVDLAAAIGQKSYIRSTMFGRFSGYAAMYLISNDQIFEAMCSSADTPPETA